MTVREFVDSINEKTPSGIIFFASLKQLEEADWRISREALAWLMLEGAKVEAIHFDKNCMMIWYSKKGDVYCLEWVDGCGVALSEFYPPEPLVYS